MTLYKRIILCHIKYLAIYMYFYPNGNPNNYQFVYTSTIIIKIGIAYGIISMNIIY